MSESCTGQGEVWMPLAVQAEYDQPHICWFPTTLWFHLEVQTQWSIKQGSEPHCRPFCHAVTVIPRFCKSYPVLKLTRSWNLVHAQLLPRLVNACVRQSRTSSLHSEVCMYQLSWYLYKLLEHQRLQPPDSWQALLGIVTKLKSNRQMKCSGLWMTMESNYARFKWVLNR